MLQSARDRCEIGPHVRNSTWRAKVQKYCNVFSDPSTVLIIQFRGNMTNIRRQEDANVFQNKRIEGAKSIFSSDTKVMNLEIRRFVEFYGVEAPRSIPKRRNDIPKGIMSNSTHTQVPKKIWSPISSCHSILNSRSWVIQEAHVWSSVNSSNLTFVFSRRFIGSKLIV